MTTSDERWAGLGIPKLHNPVTEPDFTQMAIDLVLIEMGGMAPPPPFDTTNPPREMCINVAATALHNLRNMLRKEHGERSTTAADH